MHGAITNTRQVLFYAEVVEKCQPSLGFNYVWGTDFIRSCLGAASSTNRNVLLLRSRSRSKSSSVQRKQSDVDVLLVGITNPSHQL